MDEDDYEVISRILASKHRKNILLELSESARTPTELADQFDEHQPTISRALSELKEMQLVKSTSQKQARLYWVVDEKQEIVEYIKNREE
ncbi:winged helix-turn-helix transcriptional regulator [Halorubellus sp. JP-L1]|uniref:helix-turn-helix domain-containing protein n=1 Tax=Halorubellus sp. JP-L1 TaxID=2715753 RepID=UPI001408206A|nr:helix-turn-helix domain-containing protein [Halorubellus sp. JP-L1]NHN43512.1 winged helix-turn-helix transcriptional regulator [Halorubellus sp. JP-L1]